MANIICEYKRDRNEQGIKIKPLWLDKGGVWYDPDNYTFIGVIKDLEVWVPETVTHFTKESFVERQLDIHSRYPFRKNQLTPPLEPFIELTEEEVTTQVEEWWDKNI